jgi:hypothetical protein
MGFPLRDDYDEEAEGKVKVYRVKIRLMVFEDYVIVVPPSSMF